MISASDSLAWRRRICPEPDRRRGDLFAEPLQRDKS
jgi:hypothetical protein